MAAAAAGEKKENCELNSCNFPHNLFRCFSSFLPVCRNAVLFHGGEGKPESGCKSLFPDMSFPFIFAEEKGEKLFAKHFRIGTCDIRTYIQRFPQQDGWRFFFSFLGFPFGRGECWCIRKCDCCSDREGWIDRSTYIGCEQHSSAHIKKKEKRRKSVSKTNFYSESICAKRQFSSPKNTSYLSLICRAFTACFLCYTRQEWQVSRPRSWAWCIIRKTVFSSRRIQKIWVNFYLIGCGGGGGFSFDSRHM